MNVYCLWVGRVNGLILNRTKIQTTNFQPKYLLQFYPWLEPQNHDHPIHRDPVNGLVVLLGLCGLKSEWIGYAFEVLQVKLEQILLLKVGCSIFGSVRIDHLP